MTATRPFVDRPVTDAAAAARAAADAVAHWGLEPPVLLRVGMNAIFVCGPAVVRVSDPSVDARAALALADVLIESGVRVNRPLRDDVVESNGLSATCWHRLAPTGERIDWTEVGRMVRRVHAIDLTTIPNDYPVPPPTSFAWWHFDDVLDEVGELIDDRARAGIVTALDRHGDWGRSVDPVVCHGDVHPGNVIMTEQGPTLIDWDLLCRASPGWDHASLMTWTARWGGDVGTYEAFAAGYGRSMRGDAQAEAYAELRLVAATLMRLRAGRTDATAMSEAQRRLRYWRGDPDAPTWAAQ